MMLQAMEIVLNDEINKQQKHKSARYVAVIDELTPENNWLVSELDLFEQCRLLRGQKSPLPLV